MIEINNVSKTFHLKNKKVEALKNVSLSRRWSGWASRPTSRRTRPCFQATPSLVERTRLTCSSHTRVRRPPLSSASRFSGVWGGARSPSPHIRKTQSSVSRGVCELDANGNLAGIVVDRKSVV